MMTTREVMEQLTGKGIVQGLVTYAEQTFDDFKGVHSKYLQAIEQFRSEIEEDTSPSVDDLVDAIDRQTASDLFFSGVLGVQANYDHFRNPMARTMLDVDFDVYLRENTAHRLPEYEKAQKIIDRFFDGLSPQQKDLFDDVITYSTYLETVGPKLAHFYGYILGNEILCRVIPGYYLDEVLTIRYQRILSKYLGIERQFLLDWGMSKFMIAI